MSSETTAGDLERRILGVLSLGLVVAGGVGMVTQSEPGWPGIVLRAGIILGAIWLVLPNLRRVNRRTWATIGIPALVLLLRPQLILWGAAVGFVVWLLTRWKR